MRLSGFSFVRNGILYDYPFLESIRSILSICDEFVIAVGNSDDSTLDSLRALDQKKIRIVETAWDDSLRKGGAILAQQTNLALDQVSGDWAFYLQADEVVHELDLPLIVEGIRAASSSNEAEGFLFNYRHFYGSYSFVGVSRRWYRHEIRIVRTGIGVRSWGDAQGFRINGRKLRVQPLDATINHYGWVKSPAHQQAKQKNFNRYWHDDRWVEDHVGQADEYGYSSGGKLEQFKGTHPAVMAERVRNQDWVFRYDPAKVRQPLKERVLEWVERKTGIRIGEYRNYELL